MSDANQSEHPPSGEPCFYDPKPDLVVGVIAPLGAAIAELVREVSNHLQTLGYHYEEIRVSSLLDNIGKRKNSANSKNEFKRISEKMNAGNAIRKDTERSDILARLAIHKISKIRSEKQDSSSDSTEGTVYIVNSIKTPDEANLYRNIYGGGAILISAYEPKESRFNRLSVKIGQIPKDLHHQNTRSASLDQIERDHLEENNEEFGQKVSEAFSLADLVVNTKSIPEVKSSVKRFFDSFFGYPFHSPTKDEFGMYQARLAALRSLDMSRQVGAAVLDDDGSVVSQGHNDIPKFGGGQYWEGESIDGRDYARGEDYSVVFRKHIISEIVSGLTRNDIISEEWRDDPDKLIDYLYKGEGKSVWSDFTVSNLLEFGRPLHAEMAAILDASRKGIPLTEKTLYCTTFPCHLCARIIIGSGIRKVVYMEPYHKSKTEVMYTDSIDVDPDTPVDSKVNFTPFVGVAPEKFVKIFSWTGKRRDADGKPNNWSPDTSEPRIKRYVDTYLKIEKRCIKETKWILKSRNIEYRWE